MEVNKSRGRIDSEDIVKALVLHLEGLPVAGSETLRRSLEQIHFNSRRDALDRAGFRRKASRAQKKHAQTDGERREELERSFGLAFRGVTSLPAEIVDTIRQRIIENLGAGRAGTEEVLRSILRDAIADLDIADPEQLREAIRQIWTRTRADLQRVIRSESINAYSRVQLQEWADQGIRRVRRRSIDDDRTCATCRELSRPGRNEYDIQDLLALDYPVTQDPATGDWLTHPNCRCWFEPLIEDAWEELEGMEADLFGDITRGGASAEDVPIDAQNVVEKTLREHKDVDFNVKFVPRIVDLPEWQDYRLEELTAEVGADRARVQLLDEINFNTVSEWTDPTTGDHYVAAQAQDLDHISASVARAAAERRAQEVDLAWVRHRWKEKKNEANKTLEREGVRIFGGEPFYNQASAASPENYFIETYAGYVTNPYVLKTVDPEMYDWLNQNVFGGREFLRRGGIK
jgi:hypothetical protein